MNGSVQFDIIKGALYHKSLNVVSYPKRCETDTCIDTQSVLYVSKRYYFGWMFAVGDGVVGHREIRII